ncbi:uncharacterized protein [Aegilops tauschii subsp. strangulata]|uniref:uncharacterized protein n=1 Tax=Aegilops tauschii subsp. strangulata TaxID=200361 RepID=UPI003CC86E7B
MVFENDYAARADGNTKICVKYTNKASCVEYCIRRFKYWLRNEEQKIVALDVEYTWPRGPTQMVAVNMWRVPDPVTIKPKYGLADYAGSIIHHSYNKMKDAIREDDHHIWTEAPLPLKNIYYASMDAYATYDVYRRLVNFQNGFESQRQHLTKPSRRSKKSGRKNEST